jgi:hypothetical protein
MLYRACQHSKTASDVADIFGKPVGWLFKGFFNLLKTKWKYFPIQCFTISEKRRGTARTLPNFCVVLYIVCFVSFCVLFVCKCVLYYCHWVATQLQLTNISHHIISYHIIPYHIFISYHISCIIYNISYHISKTFYCILFIYLLECVSSFSILLFW